MKKLHFSITIDAPREKVWDTMFDDATYRQWTEGFSKGSYYEGSWEKGSTIRFLAPNEDGKPEGMISRIEENRPYEYISILHLGLVDDGVDDTSSEAVQGWAGAYENYTFTETVNGTEVTVEMDVDEEHVGLFDEMWPKALQKLKELAEA